MQNQSLAEIARQVNQELTRAVELEKDVAIMEEKIRKAQWLRDLYQNEIEEVNDRVKRTIAAQEVG